MRQPAVGGFDASAISEQGRGHRLGTRRVQGDLPEYECLIRERAGYLALNGFLYYRHGVCCSCGGCEVGIHHAPNSSRDDLVDLLRNYK